MKKAYFTALISLIIVALLSGCCDIFGIGCDDDPDPTAVPDATPTPVNTFDGHWTGYLNGAYMDNQNYYAEMNFEIQGNQILNGTTQTWFQYSDGCHWDSIFDVHFTGSITGRMLSFEWTDFPDWCVLYACSDGYQIIGEIQPGDTTISGTWHIEYDESTTSCDGIGTWWASRYNDSRGHPPVIGSN